MEEVSRRQDEDVRLWFRISRLSNHVSQILERRLVRQLGVSLTDFVAIMTLEQSGLGSMRMQELSEAVGVGQSTLSRVALRLEHSGLVTRRTSEHDRRGTQIELTDQGRAVVAEGSAVLADSLNTAFELAAHLPGVAPLLALIRPTDGLPTESNPSA
ncbi:MarR family winged helix-turn-helix transcriptional regulator [Sphaerimonospora cavernae]|uniref:MarR family winged helix-turn-helix transcriptional regulator n=1 Tax=Sphaerimonospora cavernae TaxID=1740611 RepID=A0ABV6UCQ7_9ACTN